MAPAPTPPPPSSVPQARILPPEEWDEKLADTPLGKIGLDPLFAIVIVVEIDGKVVAQWTAQNVVHVEGLWVDDAHRGNVAVARLLLGRMAQQLVEAQVPEVLTNADSALVETMIEKVGGSRVPGNLWVIPIAGLGDY